MKKLYITLCFGLLSTVSMAQFMQNGSSVTGQTFNAVADSLNELLYEHGITYENNTGSAMNIKVRRVLICKTPNITFEQLCYGGDQGSCFSPNGTDYTTPGSGWPLADGEEVQVDPKFVGVGEDAAAEAWIYAVDASDNSMLDSIHVFYTWGNGSCTAGIEDASLEADISAYPNPANGFVNFNVELQGAQNAELAIVDMLGKQVYVSRVSANQNHKVNTSTFKQGIYFYSIKVGGQVLETKKLVVKH